MNSQNSLSPVVLIVDDSPQNLQVLGKILQVSGYEIEFATNGEAALEWLGSRQFDLVLLDINMPGINGFEVCAKIRLNPSLNNVPVIFLSSETDRESILMGFEYGAQDYITKPFDSRELLVRVRTHLALKNSLEKLETLNKSLEEKVFERTQQLNEANEKLKNLNLDLMDLDKEKSEFLKLISHEIRTPLNGIITPMELLKGPVYPREIGNLIEILDLSVKRLERFALDALLITRLKIKPYEIVKDKINLSTIITEILKENKIKLLLGNIHINRIDDGTTNLIWGETDLIKKCIINILENAIRFSPQNGTIKINTFIEDHTIICEIQNNGNRISDIRMNTIFDLCITGKEYNDNNIGIDLPIAKMIMEAHGGTISIKNNPGGGVLVKLQFQTNIVT